MFKRTVGDRRKGVELRAMVRGGPQFWLDLQSEFDLAVTGAKNGCRGARAGWSHKGRIGCGVLN